MYGYIYITIPKSAKWCYIGKRVKSKFDTNYVGSGVVIKDYLKTHKKADLICKILEKCDSKESLENAEVIWIENFHNECGEKCKNIAIGGAGGCTPETAPNRGKIPIYKDDKYIWIYDNEFSKYEADGWKKGQPEFINKKKGKANKGKIPIYKGDKYIYIIPEEFSKYEADGWKKGQTELSNEKRSNSGKGKKRIHKGDEDKWVSVEEYDYYIELGWMDGASDRTKQKQREAHNNKSDEEKEEWGKKISESLNNMSDEEKQNLYKKRGERISEAKKGITQKKFKYQTPSGEIKIMDKGNANKHHSDWILIGPVE